MAFFHATKWVTDGLITYIDSNNPACYNGTGTAINDLSGKGNNWTIQGNVSWSAINGWGNFTGNSLANGNKIYANSQTPYNNLKTGQGGNGYTFCIFARSDNTSQMQSLAADSSWRKLIANNDGDNYIDIYRNINYPYGYHQDGSGETLFINEAVQVTNDVFSMGDGQWRMYSGTNTNGGVNSNPSGTLTLGNEPGSSNSYPWLGQIAVVMIYNRVLTPSEISQNYWVFKDRWETLNTNTAAGITITNFNIQTSNFPTPDASNRGAVLYNNGVNTYWSYPGATSLGTGFRYRSTITHGYISAGYKGANTWRSVNRTWHATDITIYCGEQLDKSGAYLDGHWSDYNAYIHATNDAFQGASAHTSSYNLATGMMRTRGEGTNSPFSGGFTFPATDGSDTGTGGWNLNTARSNFAGVTDQVGQAGYVFGGGSTVTERMHYPTETMFVTTTSPASAACTSGITGQLAAWLSYSGDRRYFTWSNQTFSVWSTSVLPDGYMKGVPTKWDFHYAGNHTNTAGSTYSKFSDINGTTSNGSIASPSNNGESNVGMGQDWGYMFGGYDGQQNNRTMKFIHSTDTIIQLTYSAQPKGHYGQSSACCASAAMGVCGGQGVGI
jgi:hypothetical protein